MPRSKVVVCDNGSGLVKCGFAGDTLPHSVFPCVVGRKSGSTAHKDGSAQVMVGSDCLRYDQHVELSYPMRNGMVDSWEDMQRIWDHAFHNELQIKPAESKILLTDAAMNPTVNRQKMLEMMFEQYGFETVNLQLQAVLTLYSQGLLSGLVVDSGDGVSSAVAVMDGYAFPHVTKRSDVAGRHISAHLLGLLRRRGYVMHSSSDVECVREAKEKLCYTAVDFDKEMKLARETTCTMKSYTLPDGRVIRVGAERFIAPEALFNPSLVDLDCPGIGTMAFNCINDMSMDTRRCLYENVVISGGSTMFPGFPTRLQNELTSLYSKHILKGEDGSGASKVKIRVSDSPNRKHTAFLGGAVLGEIMKDHTDFWISREDYAEDPHRALKKCSLA